MTGITAYQRYWRKSEKPIYLIGMFPGCIRAPRSTQGSTDDITKQTKSIVQVSYCFSRFIETLKGFIESFVEKSFYKKAIG